MNCHNHYDYDLTTQAATSTYIPIAVEETSLLTHVNSCRATQSTQSRASHLRYSLQLVSHHQVGTLEGLIYK